MKFGYKLEKSPILTPSQSILNIVRSRVRTHHKMILTCSGYYSHCFFCHSESKTFIIEDGCVVGLGNLMTPRFDRRLVGKLDSTSQLRRNTFFTYEYLYHFGMVDAEGKCRGLAGIATHLVRCEPANLSKSFCFRYFIC